MSRRPAGRPAGRLRLLLAACLLLAGCSRNSDDNPDVAASGDPFDLRDVCPAVVTIQTDFNPESEYGATYNLLGAKYTVDDKRKTVRGPLVTDGRDTGVQVEIRAGGPAVEFTDPGELLYKDPSITLGFVSTDSQIAQYDKYPTLSVVAPMSINPQILMWAADKHPELQSVGDLSTGETPIVTFKDATYGQYLVTTGIISPKQWRQDYDGTDQAWIASGGKIIQQGFRSSEPYLYEKKFGTKIDFILLYDMRYRVYTQTLGIRTADRAKLAPCLTKLVPIVQRSQVSFLRNPTRANALIVALAARPKWRKDTGWDYPADLAAYSVQAQRAEGLITVDRQQRVGLFDMNRVEFAQREVQLAFVSQSPRVPYKPGIAPTDLATNQFIDLSVRLPAT